MNFFVIAVVLLFLAAYLAFRKDPEELNVYYLRKPLSENMTGLPGPIHLISNNDLMHLKYAGN